MHTAVIRQPGPVYAGETRTEVYVILSEQPHFLKLGEANASFFVLSPDGHSSLFSDALHVGQGSLYRGGAEPRGLGFESACTAGW